MARTILVVDDDPTVLQAYGRLLRRLGHRVLLADNPERVRADPESLRGVDLLILDQRMPKTSGLELLASLRQRPISPGEDGALRPPPMVILISAFLSEEIRDGAVRLGVAQVIEKPVDPSFLLASVRAALDNCLQRQAPAERSSRP